MRLALISDIHANLAAFEAVLADIDKQKVKKIHSLGDVIGYGPEPVECLELVEERCSIKLMGNHEYVVMGLESLSQMNETARKSAEWTISQLGGRGISILADYDMLQTVDHLTLVHASPLDPEHWHYILTLEEAKLAFNSLKTQICLHGHTHLPMVFTLEPDGTIRQKSGMDFEPKKNNKYLVNVGSVGQPRDSDPRASYAIFDTDSGKVSFRRVEYDVQSTQNKMMSAEMPRMLIDRLAVGR